ncbi:MAG: glycosyltransferase family 9 protein [Oligoflexia bacterium]|nr:glycosyltransferase family 9 protein [Oligoflexia bacterium]
MIRFNCRHYVGHKPCKHKRTCDGCGHFDAYDTRILVIKLGALGDLLRTTPVLPSLKARYPRSQLTWLTKADCLPLLDNLTEIDRLWVTDSSATARVLAENFDLLINFDKEAPAAELATIAHAREKRGFGLSPQGALIALNGATEYALQLGLDDELKFRTNQKTYQQIAHELAELPFTAPGPNYQIRLRPEEAAFGPELIASQLHLPGEKRLLGINAGAGRVFATKKWHGERFAELAIRLYADHGLIPLLLGGPDEIALNDSIHKELRKAQVPVVRPGENLTLRQFISVVAGCSAFVTGDTLGMHIALAMGVPTTAIFTSTCSQEIEFYGRGRAVVGQAACAPCYLARCRQATQHCANSVDVEAVHSAVSALLAASLTFRKSG